MHKVKLVVADPEQRLCLSRGEYLAVALVLNQADWIKDAGFTLAGALSAIDDDWVKCIPKLEWQLAEERINPRKR